jgi:methionyl-tRNA formyltransferase
MSIIWPIYEGVAEAGFTIHQIDRGIDTGRLLHVERFPIRFKENLRATYRENVVEIRRRVPRALVEVVARYDDHVARSSKQGEGQTYTTPSLRQFLHMLRQHRRLRRAAQPSTE